MKYLLVGYYGFGNAGDGWLLENVIRKIKKHDSEMQYWYRYGKGVRSSENKDVSKKDVWETVDTIVLGGGTLFQDKTSFKSLLYYVGVCLKAKRNGKRLWLLGQGMGPLDRLVSRVLVQKVLRLADMIRVRDEAAFEETNKLLDGKGVLPILAADLVYSGTEYKNIKDKKNCVGVSLRQTLRNKEKKLVKESIESVSIEREFIIADKNQDERIANEIGKSNRSRLLSDLIHDPIGYCGVVTMRYHVAVWASLNGIPFLAISNDPKLISLASELGQPSLLVNMIATPNLLKKTIGTFLNSRLELGKSLKRNVPKLIERAELNIRVDEKVL